ncbi:MAG: hypothetical protein JNK14_19655 [Chitinophagaceae bacterium]|nr:hypothetical protein [Chitinophagaceae bacterium]
MKLNRQNYEEYFILYLDNELSSEDRRMVEIFAEENPDLKAELDMLLQTKLSPDTAVTFDNKEALLFHNSSPINLNNYEEQLLSYIDNELTVQEAKDVERFVAENPAIKKELELFQKTKLQPEVIVHPDKESLYRREEKVRVVPIAIGMRWWRIAAAAVLLIGISTTVIVLLNNKKENGQDDLASGEPKTEKTTEGKNSNTQPVITPQEATQEIAATTPDEPIQGNKETAIKTAVVTKQKTNTTNENKQQALTVVPEETAIANNDNEKKQGNNLPTTELNPYANGKPDPKQNETIAQTEVTPEILTTPDKNTDIGAVTVASLQPSEEVIEPSGKKNKLRGFFRKITRTFEKRTNIKATDGENEDRLLIAGLAIKLN